jgi:hypothetical protein
MRFAARCRSPHEADTARHGPQCFNWFKRFNKDRTYSEQVKPFNFLLTFFPRRQEDIATEDPTHEWDPKLEQVRPVAPFEKDADKALNRIFDRNSESMDAVSQDRLRTMTDVLRDYHRQPEYKFLGGGWIEEGVLRRRHVFADSIEDIGKESDGWEEDDARTEDQDTVLITRPRLLIAAEWSSSSSQSESGSSFAKLVSQCGRLMQPGTMRWSRIRISSEWPKLRSGLSSAGKSATTKRKQ